jgi:hypothetical protein
VSLAKQAVWTCDVCGKVKTVTVVHEGSWQHPYTWDRITFNNGGHPVTLYLCAECVVEFKRWAKICDEIK